MPEFTEVAQGDNEGIGSPKYQILVYPNQPNDRSLINDVVINGSSTPGDNGLIGLCEQLLDEYTIDSYEIYTYNSELGINADDVEDFHSSFDSYINQNNYDVIQGTHLGIASGFSGGLGNSPTTTDNKSALSRYRHASLGTDYQDDNETSVLSVHECLHTITNNAVNGVDQAIGDVECDICDYENHPNYDHFLGKLEGPSNSAASTPLVASYGRHVWSQGGCNSPDDYSVSKYTTDLSMCEELAVSLTADNE